MSNWPPLIHQDVQDAVLATRLAMTRNVLPTVTVSGAYAETFPRFTSAATGVSPTSGIPRLSAIRLRLGEVVTSLTFFNGATALATGTHQWAALCDTSGNVLAVSADDTSNAWAANVSKTFTMVAPYTVTGDAAFYALVNVVATTTPNMQSLNIGGNLATSYQPFMAASAPSNTGSPPTVGTSVGTLTAQAVMYYAVVA